MKQEDFEEIAGSKWAKPLKTIHPNAIKDAVDVFVETRRDDAKKRWDASIVILTDTSLLWLEIVKTAGKATEIKTASDPLSRISISSVGYLDEWGNGGDITSYEVDLASESGWSIRLPNEDQQTTASRRRLREFEAALMKKMNLGS